MLDKVDLKILSMIQKNARISNAEISRRLKMAPSGILERLRKLKKKKVIKDYITQLDANAIDMNMLAFVFITTDEKSSKWDVGSEVAKIPEVLEVHDIAGEDCYLVKLRTKDTDSLYKLIRNKFGNIKSLKSCRTTIVLRTVKESIVLPIEQKKG